MPRPGLIKWGYSTHTLLARPAAHHTTATHPTSSYRPHPHPPTPDFPVNLRSSSPSVAASFHSTPLRSLYSVASLTRHFWHWRDILQRAPLPRRVKRAASDLEAALQASDVGSAVEVMGKIRKDFANFVQLVQRNTSNTTTTTTTTTTTIDDEPERSQESSLQGEHKDGDGDTNARPYPRYHTSLDYSRQQDLFLPPSLYMVVMHCAAEQREWDSVLQVHQMALTDGVRSLPLGRLSVCYLVENKAYAHLEQLFEIFREHYLGSYSSTGKRIEEANVHRRFMSLVNASRKNSPAIVHMHRYLLDHYPRDTAFFNAYHFSVVSSSFSRIGRHYEALQVERLRDELGIGRDREGQHILRRVEAAHLGYRDTGGRGGDGKGRKRPQRSVDDGKEKRDGGRGFPDHQHHVSYSKQKHTLDYNHHHDNHNNHNNYNNISHHSSSSSTSTSTSSSDMVAREAATVEGMVQAKRGPEALRYVAEQAGGEDGILQTPRGGKAYAQALMQSKQYHNALVVLEKVLRRHQRHVQHNIIFLGDLVFQALSGSIKATRRRSHSVHVRTVCQLIREGLIRIPGRSIMHLTDAAASSRLWWIVDHVMDAVQQTGQDTRNMYSQILFKAAVVPETHFMPSKLLNLITEMEQRGFEPHGPDYSNAAQIMAKRRRWIDASQILETMAAIGVHPLPALLQSFDKFLPDTDMSVEQSEALLRVCHHHPELSSLETILRQQLVLAAAKEKDTDLAFQVWDRLQSEGSSVDRETVEALFHACGARGEGERAIGLLRQHNVGFKTCAYVLKAFGRRGERDLMQTVERILEERYSPEECHSVMLTGYASAGMVAEAESSFRKLKESRGGKISSSMVELILLGYNEQGDGEKVISTSLEDHILPVLNYKSFRSIFSACSATHVAPHQFQRFFKLWQSFPSNVISNHPQVSLALFDAIVSNGFSEYLVPAFRICYRAGVTIPTKQLHAVLDYVQEKKNSFNNSSHLIQQIQQKIDDNSP